MKIQPVVTLPAHIAVITVGHIALSMSHLNEQIEELIAEGGDNEGLADFMEAHEQAERLRNYIVHQVGGDTSSVWPCADADCHWLNTADFDMCENCGTHRDGSL